MFFTEEVNDIGKSNSERDMNNMEYNFFLELKVKLIYSRIKRKTHLF